MQILIVFAHPLEAAPTLDRLRAEPLSDQLYSFEQGKILITGMGPYQAGSQTAAHATDCDVIWNLGLAGALNPSLPVGSIHTVGKISREGYDPITLGEGAHLLTSPTPVWGPIDSPCDLVDMEGHAIASATTLPTYLWKIVSDHTETEGRPKLQARLPTLAAHLSEVVIQALTEH